MESPLCDMHQEEAPSPKHDIRRNGFWKTVAGIIGLLLAAFFSAIGHYLLVRNLNGKLVETSYLTQPQVSAVSILLTTTFKAAITASMGTCFAQYLWFRLRGNAIALSVVEKLFGIRSNILAFGDLRCFWTAPVLSLMALLIWCLGLATIYPPGALSVTLEAHTYSMSRNISVMNPLVLTGFDPYKDYRVPNLGANQISYVPFYGLVASGEIDHGKLRELRYSGPSASLVHIAQVIMANDRIFTLPGHPGENSTYSIQFRGPQLRCKTLKYNETVPMEYERGENDSDDSLTARLFSSAWDPESFSYSAKRYRIQNRTVRRNVDNMTNWEAFCSTEEDACNAVSVLYNVSISYPRGTQQIQYTASDPRTLSRTTDMLGQRRNISLLVPPAQKDLDDWKQKVFAALPLFNEWALLEAFEKTLEGNSSWVNKLVSWDNEKGCELSPNSTKSLTVWDCDGNEGFIKLEAGHTPMRGTIFQKTRFGDLDSDAWYDPRDDLDLTQEKLNDSLAKFIISAITAGTWWDMVPVTTTRHESTYTLAHPLNLILPYSICFLASTIFAAIAIWSLWKNGVPAVDGGFLQVMISTRGDTEMNRHVVLQSIEGLDDMAPETKEMKVRYGRLVDQDTSGNSKGHLGFGTVEETVSLRKRK